MGFQHHLPLFFGRLFRIPVINRVLPLDQGFLESDLLNGIGPAPADA